MELIKHNQIIVWKGFKWSKLLKFWNLDNIVSLGIQLATLSRFRHTAIYYQYLGKEYLVHSGAKKGIHIIEITGEQWFRANIQNNIYDLYEYRLNHEKRTDYERYITSCIQKMFNDELKEVRIGSYNYLGILNQFVFNILDKSPFQKKTNSNKMFCSEMTMFYFTENENSFLYSPFALTDSDLFRKVK